MDEKVIEIIKTDIIRCEQQTTNEGSYQLYQALIGKYNGLFPGFSNDIPKSGKISTGGAFNYRPELNAIKEKLELILVTEQNKDPLYKFKEMMSKDIAQLKAVIEDDIAFDEKQKQQIYLSVTAKYHPHVPHLGDGLYQYFAKQGFYDEVTGSSLEYNLRQIYNKLLTFQSLNYPGLGAVVASAPSTVVNISNTNSNSMTVTFDSVRNVVDNMTSLPDEDIQEIQNRIDELEEFVNSKATKNKKWSQAKDIIKWIADKGVDVGIALLPLLLKIA